MKLLNKLKTSVWNIGFIDTPAEALLRGEAYAIRWMRHPYRDRFFADPFLEAETDTHWMLLVEEYSFWLRRGRIVRLTVSKADVRLCKRELLIDTPYHLSYPFIWKKRILPEQSASGAWTAYDHSGTQPDRLASLGLVDATICSDGATDWVFACRAGLQAFSDRNMLFRYHMVNGKVDTSSEQLVKTGDSACRPGGAFFRINGQLYRPAQNSCGPLYGESITLCKVLRNDDTGFEEVPVVSIHSHREQQFHLGLHTFTLAQSGVVVDGFDTRLHPFFKIASFITRKRFKP